MKAKNNKDRKLVSLASCDLLLHVVSYLLIYKGKFLLPSSLKNGELIFGSSFVHQISIRISISMRCVHRYSDIFLRKFLKEESIYLSPNI